LVFKVEAKLDVLTRFQTEFRGGWQREGVSTSVLGELGPFGKLDGNPTVLLQGNIRGFGGRLRSLFCCLFCVFLDEVGSFFCDDAKDAFCIFLLIFATSDK